MAIAAMFGVCALLVVGRAAEARFVAWLAPLGLGMVLVALIAETIELARKRDG